MPPLPIACCPRLQAPKAPTSFTRCLAPTVHPPCLCCAAAPRSVLTPLQVAKACVVSYPYIPDSVALMHEFESSARKARQAQQALAGAGAGPGAGAGAGAVGTGIGAGAGVGSGLEQQQHQVPRLLAVRQQQRQQLFQHQGEGRGREVLGSSGWPGVRMGQGGTLVPGG